jgi:hypothetical protein
MMRLLIVLLHISQITHHMPLFGFAAFAAAYKAETGRDRPPETVVTRSFQGAFE